MAAKIHKWGNSLGLRIPKNLALEAGIEEGTAIDLKIKNGRLLVIPLKSGPYKLADLLAEVTEENIHEETDFGPPQGKEVW